MDKILKQRTTSTENVSFIAVMAALTAVVCLFSYFVPIGGLISLLFLPLISLLVTYLCKPKFVLIYAISSIVVTALFTFFDIYSILLFVLPTLALGICFGFCLKKDLSLKVVLILSSFINFIISLIAFVVIQALSGLDVLEIIKEIFGLNISSNYSDFAITFVFVYSFCEVLVSWLFLNIITPQFLSKINAKVAYFPFFGLEFSIACFVFSFINQITTNLLFVISMIGLIFDGISIVQRGDKKDLIISGICLFVTFISFPCFYSLLPEGKGMLLLLLLTSSISIIESLNEIKRGGSK